MCSQARGKRAHGGPSRRSRIADTRANTCCTVSPMTRKGEGSVIGQARVTDCSSEHIYAADSAARQQGGELTEWLDDIGAALPQQHALRGQHTASEICSQQPT